MLTKTQKEYIIGFLLGDAYCEKHPVNCRLGFHHGLRQLDYVRWKHQLLSPYSGKLTEYQAWDKKMEKFYQKCRFCTYTREEFNVYRQLFYPKGKKIVPENIADLLTEKSLVVWYLDDGHYTKERYSFRLCTNAFSSDDLQLLRAALLKNFSLSTTLISSRSSKKGKRLTNESTDYVLGIGGKSAEKMGTIIRPLIERELPLFRYKLLKPRNDCGNNLYMK